MAACTLDISHPCFLASLGRLQDNPDMKEALDEIKKKVESEHTSCNRVVQQFWGNSKFTQLHGKIWKYDWGKSSASGRKSWRMVVVVPDPTAQPYQLIAAAIYPKSATEQLPLRELAEIYACVTTASPSISASVDSTQGEFHRVPNGDGQTRSICLLCYVAVAVSLDMAAIDKAESSHRCDLATD